MKLKELYEMQKVLDQRIIDQHNLGGVDLLPNTVLALQVEIAELANCWRGFKHWSKDQNPRLEVVCHSCKGNKKFSFCGIQEDEDCSYCDGSGIQERPLLEEYVDCLHFFLSIARQLGLDETDLTIIDDYLEGSTTKVLTRLIYHSGGIDMGYTPYSAITSFRMAFNMFFALGQQRFGFTLEQIEAAYLDKNKVNHERQANGY